MRASSEVPPAPRPAGSTTAPLFETRALFKAFPGVVALDRVSISGSSGEIMGLVGENGAGKSTLMRILSGGARPDDGVVVWDGTPVDFKGPADAVKLGIEIIPQELSLAGGLSVAENIMMGAYPSSFGRVRWPALRAEATRLASMVALDVDVRREARLLSPAEQRLVMIARALARRGRVVIMDEPTVALPDRETQALLTVTRRLRDAGVTVIYVSHRLDEVLELADRVVVMRNGRVVSTVAAVATDKDELIQLMLGRSLGDQFPARSRTPHAEPVLRVRNLSGGRVRNVSFDLRKGEILGLAGLIGAGRTEIARMLFAADRYEGQIELDGRATYFKHPRDAIKAGLALLPEDRRGQGAVVDMSVAANVTLPSLHTFAVPGAGYIRSGQEGRVVRERIDRLNVSTPSVRKQMKFLSGGNQQKALIAKWELTEARILMFDEPTAGVDVGAKQEIYRLITELADRGAAIILISSELEEVVGLAHRVIVMREGEVAGELTDPRITEQNILSLCFAGGDPP